MLLFLLSLPVEVKPIHIISFMSNMSHKLLTVLFILWIYSSYLHNKINIFNDLFIHLICRVTQREREQGKERDGARVNELEKE